MTEGVSRDPARSVWRRFWPRTLRWRLQAWQGFLSLCMITGFGIATYELQRANRLRHIDADLEMRVTALRRAMRDVYGPGPVDGRPEENRPHGPPPFSPGRRPQGLPPPEGRGPRRPPPHHGPPPDLDAGSPASLREISLPAETAALFGPAAGDFFYTLWYRGGTVVGRSMNAPLDSPVPEKIERDTVTHFRTRGLYREAFHCSTLGDCAMAGLSIAGDEQGARAFAWLLVGAGAAVLCLGVGVGWWLTNRAISPVAEISRSAMLVAEGRLSERVSVSNPDDELGRLAGVLNATFARLEAAFARQQQFTSDAAHELRTPLAIMISETQTTLARPRAAEEYKESLEGCLDIAQQMRKLTETLLDLARLDSGSSVAPRCALDLAEPAARCSERLLPLAIQYGVSIVPELSRARVFASRERIELVIVNLLANALTYNVHGGEVRISTGEGDRYAVLTVADTGVGIAPADLPHIFDRFYRADKARSRANGHAGLGLAICRSILEAEQGTIEVESELGKGTVFTVRLPLSV